MYLNRPKSSRLLSRGTSSEKENGKRNGDGKSSVTETSTTSIAGLDYYINFFVATNQKFQADEAVGPVQPEGMEIETKR